MIFKDFNRLVDDFRRLAFRQTKYDDADVCYMEEGRYLVRIKGREEVGGFFSKMYVVVSTFSEDRALEMIHDWAHGDPRRLDLAGEVERLKAENAELKKRLEKAETALEPVLAVRPSYVKIGEHSLYDSSIEVYDRVWCEAAVRMAKTEMGLEMK
ncbi:MAG: hypothetical protein MJZ81_11455 [Bacteroidales bacterium]|nr:hypothetical protein [Bacteroidales bacterium]